jgi:hypothetical protein
MIKCYLIDIKNITSNLPKSKFSVAEIEQLADWILDLGGLIRPLILKQGSGEKYKVIEGHLEYYAAARAKEKNPAQADQVNAFIIPPKSQQTTIDQLAIFDRHRLPKSEDNSAPGHNQQNVDVPLLIDLLFPALSSLISQQLQPILDQLDQHKQLLTALSQTKAKVEVVEVVEVTKSIETDRVTTPDLTVQAIVNSNNPKSTKSIATNQIIEKTTKIKATKQVKSTIKSQTVATTATISKPPATKKATKTPKSTTSKQEVTSLASIDPIKATKTIDLINILSQDMLMLRMKQSKIPGADKLAVNIVSVRDIQPMHKFNDWDSILGLKISGLGVATILKIIDKLK